MSVDERSVARSILPVSHSLYLYMYNIHNFPHIHPPQKKKYITSINVQKVKFDTLHKHKHTRPNKQLFVAENLQVTQ